MAKGGKASPGTTDRSMNHCCEPNVGVQGQIVFGAIPRLHLVVLAEEDQAARITLMDEGPMGDLVIDAAGNVGQPVRVEITS